MAMSKARQRAQNKWIAKVYDCVNLTLPKGKKELVKKYAYERGESVNGFINRIISQEMARGGGNKAPSGGQLNIEKLLSPDTLKVARRAAGKTGETLLEFMMRAVEEQMKLDDISLQMGIDPAEKQ